MISHLEFYKDTTYDNTLASLFNNTLASLFNI